MLRILREYERAVVFTLGRFQRVKGPGLVLMMPFVQEMVRVDLRIQVIEIPSQDVISHDNVSMKVDAVLYFNVVESRTRDNQGPALFASHKHAGSDDVARRAQLRLQPEAPGLAGRLWQAAFSLEGARYVGAAGSRLLLNRATFGSEGRTDEVQAPWAEAYLAAHPGPADQARIGLSRGVYPAAGGQRAARAAIEAPVLAMAERMIRAGRFPAGLSTEDYFERMHISYGSPDQVAERLATDRVLPLATELIVQFSPAAPGLDEAIAALDLLATQVAPGPGLETRDPLTPGQPDLF